MDLIMAVLDMHMRICLWNHVKAYLYYVKEKKKEYLSNFSSIHSKALFETNKRKQIK